MPKKKNKLKTCWANADASDNTMTKEHACGGCLGNWGESLTWWSTKANQACCSLIGREPEDRAAASGEPLAAREHVAVPQVKSAPGQDWRSPLPKLQAGKGAKAISPAAAADAASMSAPAGALCSIASEGGAGVPKVVRDGNAAIKGTVADKSARRKRDVAAAMESAIRGAAAAIAPDDVEGALQAGYARMNGTLTDRAREQVRQAQACLKAAEAEQAGGGGKRRRSAAGRAVAAAAGKLVEARALLLGFEVTEEGVTASDQLMAEMAEQSPVERRPAMAALCRPECPLKKKQIEQLLGGPMTHDEYARARRHARFPGAFKPVQRVQQQRMRMLTVWLKELLKFLNQPDMLAQHAFGIAIIKLEAQVPAVERRKALERITCEFIAEMDKGPQAAQGAVPLSRRCSEVDERCETRRCLKGDGHEGQHAFTPVHTAVPHAHGLWRRRGGDGGGDRVGGRWGAAAAGLHPRYWRARRARDGEVRGQAAWREVARGGGVQRERARGGGGDGGAARGCGAAPVLRVQRQERDVQARVRHRGGARGARRRRRVRHDGQGQCCFPLVRQRQRAHHHRGALAAARRHAGCGRAA